jgi:hypothetical protein
MFKRILLAATLGVCAILGSQQARADVFVQGYFRADGTYVAPHFRSNPDHNFYNNWSTYPNINPYTGQMGTRLTPSYSPRISYPSYPFPSYSPRYGWSNRYGR